MVVWKQTQHFEWFPSPTRCFASLSEERRDNLGMLSVIDLIVPYPEQYQMEHRNITRHKPDTSEAVKQPLPPFPRSKWPQPPTTNINEQIKQQKGKRAGRQPHIQDETTDGNHTKTR
jgi:hypothetical protein